MSPEGTETLMSQTVVRWQDVYVKCHNPSLHFFSCLKLTTYDHLQESSNTTLKANPIQVATNKYDQLLKSSCDQLEKCSSTSAINNYQQPLATCCNQTVKIRPIEISSNKYEDIVRSSCDQLERCILNVLSKSSSVPKYEGYEQSRSRIPSVGDDYSSLDSVVTVSDYGSMPRSQGLSRRDPSCSPSAYLRNLIAMRRNVVESARKDFSSFSHRWVHLVVIKTQEQKWMFPYNHNFFQDKKWLSTPSVFLNLTYAKKLHHISY